MPVARFSAATIGRRMYTGTITGTIVSRTYGIQKKTYPGVYLTIFTNNIWAY